MANLRRRLFSSGDKVMAMSDRSGQPFPYSEMVIEPGTGLLVHQSETDGAGNIRDVFNDPLIPPDAQKLEHSNPMPETVNELFLYLYDKASDEMLFIDGKEEDGVVVIL